MAREAPGLDVNDADEGDEALREIEIGLLVVEKAMSERQRSLAEVDQQLSDLQAMAGCGVSLRPSLDPVVEAASEDAGTTPLLRNSRSVTDASPEESKTCNGEIGVSDGVDAGLDATILQDLSQGEICEEKAFSSPLVAAPTRCGESLAAKQRWIQSSPEDNGKAVYEQAPEKRLAAAMATSGGTLSDSVGSRGRPRREGTAQVTRMSSGPRPAETVLPPRPYAEAPGSLRCASPRTTSLEPQIVPVAAVVTPRGPNGVVNGGTWAAFGYQGPAATTASVSPRRVASVRSAQTEANSSNSSLSKGVFTPLTPRGSSLPADARRIFSGQAPPVSVGTPNVSSPRNSFGNSSVTGSFTPRLPHQAVSSAVTARAAGYPGIVANVSIPNGVATTVDMTPRRSPPSPLSPRQHANATIGAGMGSAAAYAQYGNRFSAVTPAAPVQLTGSSRNNTPQPVAASGRSSASAAAAAAVLEAMGPVAAGARFVPVAVPAYAAEARSRDSSLGAAAPVPPQRAGSISRALSPNGQAMAATAVPTALWYEPGTCVQDPRGMSPATPRLQVNSQMSNSRTAQQGPSARNGIAAAAAVPSQPSRYAYVNSNARRDCPPNPREARRRGRV